MSVRKFDPGALLDVAGPGRTVAAHPRGAVIMAQGSHADTVFYLQSGLAKETIATESGKGAVVAILERGSFFGLSSLHSDTWMLSGVTAIVPCVVTAIEVETMRAWLLQPQFASIFMQYLQRHASMLAAEKIDLLFDNVERLLAKRLLALSHNGTTDIGTEITQDMLAEMVGTTRPRVNFFLNKFRSAGLIRYNGGMQVQPGLAAVAEFRVGRAEA